MIIYCEAVAFLPNTLFVREQLNTLKDEVNIFTAILNTKRPVKQGVFYRPEYAGYKDYETCPSYWKRENKGKIMPLVTTKPIIFAENTSEEPVRITHIILLNSFKTLELRIELAVPARLKKGDAIGFLSGKLRVNLK